MVLGIFGDIKDYFSNFGSNSWTDLIPFVLGLVFGFLLCVLIYILLILSSYKKSARNAKKEVIHIDDELIKTAIDNVKNEYREEASSKKAGEKLGVLKDNCWNLINDIAKIYYPKSNHPLFELSIDELINLDYYIMKRIEKLFSGKALSNLKKLKLSTILNILDKKKRIEESKAIKTANRLNLTGFAKVFWASVNFINPVYWVKKLMIDAPLQIVINKIALTIIDVVGEETSNVYSKKAFVEENDDIQKQVDELEKMLGDGTNE